jgi:hypothetical protein
MIMVVTLHMLNYFFTRKKYIHTKEFMDNQRWKELKSNKKMMMLCKNERRKK